MHYSQDTEINLQPTLECRYYIYSPHRNRNPNKSQWIVEMPDEVDCFINSHQNNWLEDEVTGWGLILQGNTIVQLGISVLSAPLKLAKFIDSNKDGLWHGYPADYARNPQDRPHTDILKEWRNQGIIQKHFVVKIRQGKLCNL